MIKSMTGFGHGSASGADFKVRIDIRSVNNRFLDIHTKLPQELASIEMTLKKQIQGALRRGRIDVTVSVESLKPVSFEINRPLVSGFLSALAELKRQFNLQGEPSLELVAKLPGALQPSQDCNQLDEAVMAGIVSATSEALASLNEMRVIEGQELAAELLAHLQAIERQLPLIEEQAQRLPFIYREKLIKRAQDMLSGQIDETRLAQEAVILADRSDISEEITRLKSHIRQVREIIHSNEEAGKKLDFILQEMNREATTILSKSGELAISEAAIVIKTEVEKLREQVQNVE
jgi:uncharacterized protein (TIGR00255 family)